MPRLRLRGERSPAEPQAVQWEILDIEEDEWEQRIAADPLLIVQSAHDPGDARADRKAGRKAAREAGRRVARTAPGNAPGTPDSSAGDTGLRGAWGVLAASGRRRLWQSLAAAVLVVAACVLVGCRLWSDADNGIKLIKADIANTVKLEELKTERTKPGLDEQAQVQSIDFQNDKAMVQLVVKRSTAMWSVVKRETRFYVRSGDRWLRSSPQPDLFGAQETLDTANLRFVYRAVDRDAVRKVAADADKFYAALHEVVGTPVTGAPAAGAPAAGSTMVKSTPQLTITVAAESVMPDETADADGLHITSPLLTWVDADRSSADVLGWFVRSALVSTALQDATQHRQLKGQWRPLAAAVSGWLYGSDDLPLSHSIDSTTVPDAPLIVNGARLDYLLDCADCMATIRYPAGGFAPNGRRALAEQFVEFVVHTYGAPALGRLYQGLSKYTDWNALAPAALGVSAAELEQRWRASVGAGL